MFSSPCDSWVRFALLCAGVSINCPHFSFNTAELRVGLDRGGTTLSCPVLSVLWFGCPGVHCRCCHPTGPWPWAVINYFRI